MNNRPALIRRCETVEDWEKCVALQSRLSQGHEADCLSVAFFALAAETGGQILGIFAADELIGFSLALVALEDGVPYLHSYHTEIAPAFEDLSLKTQLRLAQRHDATEYGFRNIN